MNHTKQKTVEKKTADKNSVGRLMFATVCILVEVGLFFLLFTTLDSYAQWISLVIRAASFLLVLIIYSRHETPSVKLSWIILILALPVIGVATYLMVELAGTPRKMYERISGIDSHLMPYIPQDPETMDRLREHAPGISTISHYLQTRASYPVYGDSDITYYPDASLGLQAQLEALSQAEHFIFMEYHAIENAESWHFVQDILAAKAKAGVEVRVFYDDVGSIGFLDRSFIRQLENLGIQCRVFNPVVPFFKMLLNNRDHRKITVVDGKAAFTGGYNMANEYFNLTHPYGHWKDTGVKITGPAVKSFTVMFLEMWNAIKDSDVKDVNFDRYLTLPESLPAKSERSGHGFIQPYADMPLNKETVAENVYLALIEQSKEYIYFTTPYLVITDEMNRALGLAAKRGVDVRIITPGIPDKKTIYGVTRSYYNGLVRNGVRIYEYTPGFIHAKLCVTDDTAAVCGSINLDYRSLYHHFEDAVLFCDVPAVADVKKDIESTFALCHEVTDEYNTGRSAPRRARHLILRLFSPLL